MGDRGQYGKSKRHFDAILEESRPVLKSEEKEAKADCMRAG
jgi:hypothetical protein